MLPKRTALQAEDTSGMGFISHNGGFSEIQLLRDLRKQRLYASIFMIPVRIVMWTIGMSAFMKGSTGRKSRETQPVSKVHQSLHCGGVYWQI